MDGWMLGAKEEGRREGSRGEEVWRKIARSLEVRKQVRALVVGFLINARGAWRGELRRTNGFLHVVPAWLRQINGNHEAVEFVGFFCGRLHLLRQCLRRRCNWFRLPELA